MHPDMTRSAHITSVVEIRNLTFGWTASDTVLDIASFQVAAGETLFLRGASGSGKSTLLGLIGGVLSARSGTVRVVDQEFSALDGTRRDAVRATHLGVIFQLFNLLPYLSILDNVLLPCSFSARRKARAEEAGATVEDEALRLLERLGLGDKDPRAAGVHSLSVGQQQRVAVARALIGGPDLILADEPTSALDSDARDAFLDLLGEECQRYGSALLFVSHDAALASRFDRSVDLGDINRAAAGRAQ